MIGSLAIALVLLVVAVSAVFYKHRGRQYASGKERKIRSPESFRWVYRYIQLSTLLSGVAAGLSRHWLTLSFHDSLTLQLAGAVLTGVGLLAFVAAKLALGAQYSPCFDSFVPNRVVRSGMYRWIRHPIYTANLALVLGLAFTTASGWIAVNWLLLLVYYSGSAREEERVLAGTFPEYRDYVRTTGRFLPRVS